MNERMDSMPICMLTLGGWSKSVLESAQPLQSAHGRERAQQGSRWPCLCWSDSVKCHRAVGMFVKNELRLSGEPRMFSGLWHESVVHNLSDKLVRNLNPFCLWLRSVIVLTQKLNKANDTNHGFVMELWLLVWLMTTPDCLRQSRDPWSPAADRDTTRCWQTSSGGTSCSTIYLVCRSIRNGRLEHLTYDLQKGEIVMIFDHQLPWAFWPVGKVTRVFPGADQHVQSAEVLVLGKKYICPLVKVFWRPAAHDDDQKSIQIHMWIWGRLLKRPRVFLLVFLCLCSEIPYRREEFTLFSMDSKAPSLKILKTLKTLEQWVNVTFLFLFKTLRNCFSEPSPVRNWRCW